MERRSKGYIRTLFDLSFSEFLTSRIVRVIYVISLVVIILGAALLWLFLVAKSLLSKEIVQIIAILAGMPIILLVVVLYLLSMVRLGAELMIVLFRIAEFTRDIASGLEAKGGTTTKEVTTHYQFCTQCGTQNESGKGFCRQCGARLIPE